MLYYLFNYLEQLDFPGARMFGYVSFAYGYHSVFADISDIRRIFYQVTQAETNYGNAA